MSRTGCRVGGSTPESNKGPVSSETEPGGNVGGYLMREVAPKPGGRTWEWERTPPAPVRECGAKDGMGVRCPRPPRNPPHPYGWCEEHASAGPTDEEAIG